MRIDSETGLVIHRGLVTRSPFAVRVLQVINLAFGVVYMLLATRFVLDYLRAHDVGFVRFITQASDFFYRPFRGIVADGTDGAGHPIVWSLVIALVVFALIHAICIRILRSLARTNAADLD